MNCQVFVVYSDTLHRIRLCFSRNLIRIEYLVLIKPTSFTSRLAANILKHWSLSFELGYLDKQINRLTDDEDISSSCLNARRTKPDDAFPFDKDTNVP